MQEWKYRHKVLGKVRGGKCGSEKNRHGNANAWGGKCRSGGNNGTVKGKKGS